MSISPACWEISLSWKNAPVHADGSFLLISYSCVSSDKNGFGKFFLNVPEHSIWQQVLRVTPLKPSRKNFSCHSFSLILSSSHTQTQRMRCWYPGIDWGLLAPASSDPQVNAETFSSCCSKTEHPLQFLCVLPALSGEQISPLLSIIKGQSFSTKINWTRPDHNQVLKQTSLSGIRCKIKL